MMKGAITTCLFLLVLSPLSAQANSPWTSMTIPDTPSIVRIALTDEPVSGEISPLNFGSGLVWWEGYTAPDANGESRAWKLYKELGITCLRFPGGVDCHKYRWNSLAETRQAFVAAGHWEQWHEGTTPAGHYDYKTFLDLCRKYEITPILQVPTMAWWDSRTKSVVWLNGPERDIEKYVARSIAHAAQWVKDVRRNGYDVKIWEIGNEEVCYPGMSGKRYGRLAARYARAMRAADPSIRIIAGGGRREWNEEVLKQARNQIDYLTYHYWPLKKGDYKYPPGAGVEGSEFFSEDDLKTYVLQEPPGALYLAHLATIVEGQKMLQYDYFDLLAKTKGKVQFAWTEWNWPAYLNPFNYSIGQALLNSEQFLRMLQKDCQISTFWTATGLNFEMIKLQGASHPFYPMGDAFRLLRRHAKGRMQNITLDAPTVKINETVVPLVTAFLCKDESSRALFVLNHHPTQPAEIKASLGDVYMTTDSIRLTTLTSETLSRGHRQNAAHTDWHSVKEQPAAAKEGAVSFTLPPHSMGVLWQEEKGAD